MQFLLVGSALISAVGAAPIAHSLAEGILGQLDKRAICPKDLPALPDFDFPHLILPISKASPDQTYPNSYFGAISPNDVATVFNFDIPTSRVGKTCSLGFYFPTQDQLTTSSFTYSGPGTFMVSIAAPNCGATEGTTTYSNSPTPGTYPGFPKMINMQPGNYYSLGNGPCTAGLGSVTISSPDTWFSWFQDYNLCPLGVYVAYGDEGETRTY